MEELEFHNYAVADTLKLKMNSTIKELKLLVTDPGATIQVVKIAP